MAWQDTNTYMSTMRMVAGKSLLDPDNPWYGDKEGHLRFARVCGNMAMDFHGEDRENIIKGSYDSIYAEVCGLYPLLGIEEWIRAFQGKIKN